MPLVFTTHPQGDWYPSMTGSHHWYRTAAYAAAVNLTSTLRSVDREDLFSASGTPRT
jgi:hypothetical protein